MSKATITPMDPLSHEYRDWLLSAGFRPPTATVMHHTATKAADYRGRSTVLAHKRAHLARGFSDIAAQAYACPDGAVFTARPMDVRNFCHAYIGRKRPLANLDQYWHGDHQYLNCSAPAFGLETNAHFSLENPWVPGPAAKALECAMKVLTVVHLTFEIPVEKCFFHRQAEAKDCPGEHLDLAEFRQELARRCGAGLKPKLPLVVGPDGKVIDCAPMIVDDEMTVAAAALLEPLGIALTQIGPGVIHANGRAFVSMLARYIPAWTFTFRQMQQGPRMYVKRA